MTSPPASELDGFMSSPPIAEVALPHRGVDQSPPAKEPSFKEMAPPPRPPARGGSRLVGADFVKPEDPEQKSTFETASSQSGAQMPASSYAHTKGLTGPSETKAPQAPLTDSRSNAVTKFEDDNQLHHQDEMHASRPSTPEEQADLKAEPDGLIDAFDWSDLEARYHDMIKERDAVEQQLLQDFDHLSQVRLLHPDSELPIDQLMKVLRPMGSSWSSPRDR